MYPEDTEKERLKMTHVIQYPLFNPRQGIRPPANVRQPIPGLCRPVRLGSRRRPAESPGVFQNNTR